MISENRGAPLAPDDELLPGFVGRHPAMRAVAERVRRVAAAQLPALIVGETGTGKELVARALHGLSAAACGPFVDVNCAAVPEALAEAELFGSDRGAFTGAVRSAPGLLEVADGGTLFLDEAGSLPVAVQAKLLRAVEFREFRRVGGRGLRRSAFRLVTALAEPLDRLTTRGQLRLDFAQRVAGVIIKLPPLRERGNDITLLAERFLGSANRNGHPSKRLTSDAVAVAHRYRWPGNVRELRTIMERLEALSDGPEVSAAELLAEFTPGDFGPITRDTLQAVLDNCHWNMSHAARVLGWARSTLYQWVARHGLRRSSSATGHLVRSDIPCVRSDG